MDTLLVLGDSQIVAAGTVAGSFVAEDTALHTGLALRSSIPAVGPVGVELRSSETGVPADTEGCN